MYSLSTEEAHHCLKVLRKSKGDEIDITDGEGTVYKARLTGTSVKSCTFEIVTSTVVKKSDYRISIAISPTKSPERMEWFVEKAVEIGIDKITFFQAEHSERSHLNMDRLHKKAVSAMKQSERAFLPTLEEMKSYSKVIEASDTTFKFIAHNEDQNTLQILDLVKKNESYTVLIGPEGGFSENEIKESLKKGFVPVKLGNQRLRTETAGLVACTILSMINQ